MRIFCPATLLLPSFLLGPTRGHGGHALAVKRRAGCRRRSLPVSGAPTPAVGCVALTQPRWRNENLSRSEGGTGCARLGAGRIPWAARSRWGRPGSRQPEQYALDRGTSQMGRSISQITPRSTSQIRPEPHPNPGSACSTGFRARNRATETARYPAAPDGPGNQVLSRFPSIDDTPARTKTPWCRPNGSE